MNADIVSRTPGVLMDEQSSTRGFQPRRASASLAIRSIDKLSAHYFCRRWHYSGYAPQGPGRCYGFYDGETLIGIAVVSGVTSRWVSRLLFGGSVHAAELSRFALDDGYVSGTESRCLSLLCRQLRHDGYDAVLTYADAGQGHRGTIYQAASFTYTGFAPPAGNARFIIDGKEWSPREIYNRLGTSSRDAVRRHYGDRVQILKRYGKHRYARALRRGIRILKSEPYPVAA